MRSFFFAAALIIVAHFAVADSGGPISPTGLMVDLLEHTDQVYRNGYPVDIPLEKVDKDAKDIQTTAICMPNPCFGWVVGDSRKDVLQTACRILVSTERKKSDNKIGDAWDSGKIENDNSVAVRYAGKSLEPNTVYYWRVQTWNNGIESPFSEPKAFITAPKLDPKTTSRYPLQKTDQPAVDVKTVTLNEQIGDSGSGNRLLQKRSCIDFGKAAFGQLTLTLTSTIDRKIKVHFGEAITEDGWVNRKPGGTIRYAEYELDVERGTKAYTIKFRSDKRNTGGAAIKMPDYIGEVYPFRYVEIENFVGNVEAKDAIRAMVHYPFDEKASTFECSDETLNAVWDLCKYSMKATSFCGVFVDGDRERIPYEADALINQLGYYAVDREFSISRYSHEYLIDHATWPTEWILQSVLMGRTDYLYTGNADSVTSHYDDLKAKLLLPLAGDDGLISTKTGKQTPELLKSIHFNGKELRDIVDWPHTGILGLGKAEGGETDGFVFTNVNTVVNAYHYRALCCMAELAGVLGKQDDAKFFTEKAQSFKKTFHEMLFDTKNGRYVDGIGTEHASLHGNMFPLAFELVPAGHRKSVMDFIRSRGMACSVYGSQFLMDAVYEAKDASYGLKLLTSKDERSWYNMIRVGSTISLEAWDNKYKPNQDWNHAWGAAPANIVPRWLMGVQPTSPGFATVRIAPQPASLQKAATTIPTIRGPIDVAFTNTEKEFSLELSVPANVKATVVMPRSGKTHEIGSGKHEFTDY